MGKAPCLSIGGSLTTVPVKLGAQLLDIMRRGLEQTNVVARARYRHVRDMISTAIGMLYSAFGRAPLDGEGALPV